MPFDSNGNFSLVPGTIVSDGMTIQPSQHNPPFQDVANGLSQVALRDGRAPMTGPLNMNGNRVTGAGDAIQQTDLVNLGQVSSAIYEIGDFKDTARTLDPKWLRRNGAVYESAEYPALAPLMDSIPSGVTWEIKSSPPLYSALYAIAASPTTIVAVGQGNPTTSDTGAARISTDGNTWTSRVISSTSVMRGVAYGNGVFVAVGYTPPYDALVAVSSNQGATWATSTISNVLLQRVRFANGLFWAFGSSSSGGSKVYTSIDGTSWTEVSVGGAAVMDVAYGNGIYIATHFGGNPNSLRRSTDGITWTAITGQTFQPYGVRFDDGKFLFPCGSSVAITEDGINFDIYPTNAGGTIEDVAFVAGKGWIGIGNAGSVSNLAGTLWAATTLPSSNMMNAIIQHPFSAGKVLTVGATGQIIEGTYGDGGQFKVPDDDPEYGWIKAL